ncbi:tyrosine-type recombinase/integrase [Candidatus Pacearchaeota archaeon]|jgi:site-specific recombinase XerD|nr:tyrosine-type recombinase/integrase [Candidatus Pacearchaeota archaeon]
MSQHRFWPFRIPKQDVEGSNPFTRFQLQNEKLRRLDIPERSYERPVLDVLILSRTIEYYINALYAERKSEKTVFSYSYNLKRFLGHTGDLKIRDITVHHCRDYQAWRSVNNLSGRRKEVSAYTLHQSYRVLNAFFNWCIKEGFVEKNPMANIKPPDLGKNIIQTYTREDIQSLLSACPAKDFRGARNRAIIAMLLDTGIREDELITLNMDKIDYKGGALEVIGKKKKKRIVHISDKCRQALWRYVLLRDAKAPVHERRLFLSEEMRPLTGKGLLTIISRLGGKVGVHAYIHKFRHTCAIEFLRAGGNLATLKEMLGHESLETTMKYLTALNSDDVIKAHQEFSPGDRFL